MTAIDILVSLGLMFAPADTHRDTKPAKAIRAPARDWRLSEEYLTCIDETVGRFDEDEARNICDEELSP